MQSSTLYRRNGFTLIELLVAIAVFAVLAAMSYGGLNATLKTHEITTAEAKQLAQLQLGLTIMQRDISQLLNQSIRDEFGDPQPPLTTESNNGALLELSHAGWRNPAGQQRSTIQRVAYTLEEEVLYRHYWLHINRGPQEQALRAELLPNVDRVDFSFQLQDLSWSDSWPPLNQVNSTEMPVAVKVDITFTNDTEMSRLFDIAR